MRTTVVLPDELLRTAKAAAAARGESLKEFLTRAVSHELGSAAQPAQRHGRVELPLVGSEHPGTVDLTNADLESVLAAEDADQAHSH